VIEALLGILTVKDCKAADITTQAKRKTKKPTKVANLLSIIEPLLCLIFFVTA
jgi:hypothetical protein